MAEQINEDLVPEFVIDTISVSKGNSVAEVFSTETALLAAVRSDGSFAYARDADIFYFRINGSWQKNVSGSVTFYNTTASLLATSPDDGAIAYTADSASFYFRKAGEWVEFTVYGEITSAGNVGSGRQIYRSKSGATLQFRSLNPGSTKTTVTQNDLDVTIDVVPANIQHQALAGAGVLTHSQIDSQLDDLADHIGDMLIHRSINDAGNANTDLWSAAHIQSELDLKTDSATQLDHDDLSNIGTLSHSDIDTHIAASDAHIADATIHRVINDATASASALWSSQKTQAELALKRSTATQIDHDELSSIGARSHESLDNDIDALYAHVNEAEIHFGIDDTLIDTAYVWSSTKISTELGTKADNTALTSHASDATKHRVINDAGSASTDLWSAEKITTELAGITVDDSTFVHKTGDETIAGTKVFSSTITGSVSGNAATVTTNANLTGEVTSVGNAATVANSAVIGKVLTGYVSAAGTVAAADTVLGAIQKLNGNIALRALDSASVHTSGAETVNGTKTFGSTIVGNCSTATALQIPRLINSVSFDGQSNITVTAAAGTLSGSALASGVTSAPGIPTPTTSNALNAGTATGTGGFVSGTYTTPAGVRYIRVRMVGGGGGGGGSATANNGVTGTAGGTTTFGTSLLSCAGGTGGGGGGSSVASTGGAASLGTGPVGMAIGGAGGTSYSQSATAGTYFSGGNGGGSALGGAGAGGAINNAGGVAAVNSGSGGGGGSSPGAGQAGGGGGSGGFVDAIIIPTALQTFAYSVGANGGGGAAGTSGYAGGAGGRGGIWVTEYYI